MIKSELFTLLLFIHLAVLLIVANLYLTPRLLQTHCVSSKVHSPQPTPAQPNQQIVVDCVACHSSYTSQVFKSRVMGQVSLLIPLRPPQIHNVNLDEPFQFIPTQTDPSEDQFLYTAMALVQKQQKYFQCADLQKLDDFELNRTANGTAAAEGWTRVQPMAYKQSAVLGMQLVNRNLSAANYKILSGWLPVQPQLYSLAVKLRYRLTSQLSAEEQPLFFYYSLQENIVMRLLLLAPLLLSLHRILENLSNQHTAIRIFVGLVIVSGCLSQTLALVTATLSCYLLFGQLFHKRLIGLLTSMLFGSAALALDFSLISILPLSLLTFLIIYAAYRLQDRNGGNWQSLGCIVSVSCTILVGLVLNWSTLVLMAPIYFFSCSLQHYEPKKQGKSSAYSGVQSQQLQEEEDMVMRIERQLGHK